VYSAYFFQSGGEPGNLGAQIRDLAALLPLHLDKGGLFFRR
jgi:hypothetical protein